MNIKASNYFLSNQLEKLLDDSIKESLRVNYTSEFVRLKHSLKRTADKKAVLDSFTYTICAITVWCLQTNSTTKDQIPVYAASCFIGDELLTVLNILPKNVNLIDFHHTINTKLH